METARKVPFSTLPENAEGESGADIKYGRSQNGMKSQFHTGLKDRTSPSAVIASASTEAQQSFSVSKQRQQVPGVH